MDIKSAIAAVPILRKAWKWTPAPLRLPLLLVGAVVATWYIATGRHRDGEEAGAAT